MKARKTYILAPDLTTAPPPHGPVTLGHILADPHTLEPINVGAQHLPIPVEEIYGPHKMDGFTAAERDMRSGKFGIWAKFLASTLGIGAHTEVSFGRDENRTYKFGCLETTYFNPTKDYIRRSMDVPDVQDYMRTVKFRVPVYMITGLKVGREVAAETFSGGTRGLDVTGGLGHAGLVVGPRVKLGKELSRGMSFGRGDDCVVAIRVRRIVYEKGILRDELYTKGATMQDGRGVLVEEFVPELELDNDAADDVTEDDFLEEVHMVDGTSLDDEEDSVWIVPVLRE